jgi:hypothetical protein
MNERIALFLDTADILKLHRMEPFVVASSAQELLMGPDFSDRTAIEHDNSVGPLDRRQPVRNDEGRAVLHQIG